MQLVRLTAPVSRPGDMWRVEVHLGGVMPFIALQVRVDVVRALQTRHAEIALTYTEFNRRDMAWLNNMPATGEAVERDYASINQVASAIM